MPVVLTATIDETSVDQATSPVIVLVEASVKVPVASNCAVVPIAIEAVDGVTSIDTKVGGSAKTAYREADCKVPDISSKPPPISVICWPETGAESQATPSKR